MSEQLAQVPIGFATTWHSSILALPKKPRPARLKIEQVVEVSIIANPSQDSTSILSGKTKKMRAFLTSRAYRIISNTDLRENHSSIFQRIWPWVYREDRFVHDCLTSNVGWIL